MLQGDATNAPSAILLAFHLVEREKTLTVRPDEGGLTNKAEGFHRTCINAGPLTGAQGVVFPRSNEPALVLDDHIVDDISANRFHVY